MEFNELIFEVKKATGLKQKEIAEKIGVSQTYLSDIAGGRRDFSKSIQVKLMGLLPGGVVEQVQQKDEMPDGDIYDYSCPKVPIAAMGGPLAECAAGVNGYECERVISPVKGADLAITVTGESMYPEYPSGSTVLIKKIDPRAFIPWGEVFVLDTVNGAVIKKVVPSEKGEDYIRCVSINTEYAPYDVSKADIFGIYRVLVCMSLK